MTDDSARLALRERLAAAGIAAPSRAEAVVIDLAGDPPLGASERTIAEEEADRIVAALGAAMVAARAKQGVIAVRDREAETALSRSLALRKDEGHSFVSSPRPSHARSTTPQRRNEGVSPQTVEMVATPEPPEASRVVRVPAVWPSVGIDRDLGIDGAWVLDGERALDLDAAAFHRERAPRRLTVTGAVRRPGVLRGRFTVEEALAAAGGTDELAWAALDGGLLGGRLADPEAPVRSSLLVVLPAAHPHVARARVSLTDWLRRASSACEGCRLCSDACPVALDGVGLLPHEVIWTLVSRRDDATRLAAAAACAGCGVCDSACPSSLSPWALVDAVKARLPTDVTRPARGDVHPEREGRRMGVDLLLLRLGGEQAWRIPFRS